MKRVDKKTIRKIIYCLIRQRKKLLELEDSKDLSKKEREEIKRILDQFWTGNIANLKNFLKEEFGGLDFDEMENVEFDFSFADTFEDEEEDSEDFEQEPDGIREKVERNIWDLF